jgi:hypothetical protein
MVGAQCEIGAGFLMNESKSGEEFKLVSVSGESDGTRRSAGDNFGDAKSAFIIVKLRKNKLFCYFEFMISFGTSNWEMFLEILGTPNLLTL